MFFDSVLNVCKRYTPQQPHRNHTAEKKETNGSGSDRDRVEKKN